MQLSPLQQMMPPHSILKDKKVTSNTFTFHTVKMYPLILNKRVSLTHTHSGSHCCSC